MADIVAMMLEKGSQAAIIGVGVYLVILERRVTGIHERIQQVESALFHRKH